MGRLFVYFWLASTKGYKALLYVKLKRIQKMSKKYMLDAKGLSALSPNVKEIVSTKSVVMSVFVALIGLGIIVLSSWIEDKSSSYYIAGNTLAVVLLIGGFYRLLFKRTLLIYSPTNSEMLCGSFYLDTKYLEKLKKDITDNNDTDFSKYELLKSGNLRLDYVISRDSKFVAVQLYQYIPYTFEPACEVTIYEDNKAVNFGRFFLDNHGKI